MIKFDQTSDGFKLFYKNYLFIDHTYKNPSFKIGMGSSRYRQRDGHFKIKDNISNEFIVTNFNVLSQAENRVEIVFNASGEDLKIIFLVSSDHLEIIPEVYNENINRFWIRLSANPVEAIYGCGARLSELNLRGKTIPLWVEDYIYSTYYPQPTFISSENYFCHVETTLYSEFNFSHENYHELYIWDVPQKIIIGKHETALKVLKHVSDYFGRQPRLPDWVYDGIILGIQGGSNVVEKKLNKASESGIITCAVWCQDWEGLNKTIFGNRLFRNWKYDEELYPNLPSFIKKLNEMNIKFLGYINPFLAFDGDQYEEASKKGFCVKNPQGEDYSVKMATIPDALLDLTNPDAIKWIKSIMKNEMLGIGLSGWMHDYGEYLPTDAVLHSDLSAEEFHNQYPVIWAKTVYDVLVEENKLDEVLYFIRAGFSHASKYIMLYWPGDQLIDWSTGNALPSVITAGISLGMCGIGNYHFDIGGYFTMGTYKRDKELFMRWTEIATFTIVMRTHEGNKPEDNWQFDSDEETLKHLARMVKVHVHLKPYLKLLSREYENEGIPPIRACYLHYEDDKKLHKIEYQYLLGKDLLVAPVIKPGQDKWNVYLPEDSWVHLWSGSEYSNGWNEVSAPFGEPPVFYRKNSSFTYLFEKLKEI